MTQGTHTTTARAFDLAAVPDNGARERLAALIPSPALAGEYARRTFKGGVTDVDALGVCYELGENVLITGPTATGKSLLVRAFAALHGLPFLAIPINGTFDPSILWGRFVLNADKTMVWVPSLAALVYEYGGAVAVDELNMASPRQLAALYSVFGDERVISVSENNGAIIKVSPLAISVATANIGYEGTAKPNFALLRRFGVRWRFEYDRDIETRLVKSNALLDLAFHIRALPEIQTDLGTSALQTFERLARALSVDLALDNLVETFGPRERGGVARAVEMFADNVRADFDGATV